MSVAIEPGPVGYLTAFSIMKNIVYCAEMKGNE